MSHGQWRLLYPGADYTFGTGDLPVFNRTPPEIGSLDIRTSDVDRPRSDGRAFGVDYLGGQTLSFHLGVRATSDAEVRAETAKLRNLWRADVVRLTPGAVAELHAEYAGRTRIVYGRPRRFDPDFSDSAVNNLVDVLADFACVDDVYYGAEEGGTTVALVSEPSGGLLAPLASPLGTTRTSDRSVSIDVETELPAWPIIEIEGPITQPVIEVVGVWRMEIRTSLAEDQTLVIDTRPWVRSILRNGSASLAGSLRGTRLTDAGLPPGRHEIALRGQDSTGTAIARVRWRGSYSSL